MMRTVGNGKTTKTAHFQGTTKRTTLSITESIIKNKTMTTRIMKQIQIIIIYILVFCQQATAQLKIPFEVPVPEWTKVAICTSEDGVNIRKSPSTAAPRLLYNSKEFDDIYSKYHDDEDLRREIGFWGNKAGGNIAPFRWGNFCIHNAFPIISDSNGWLKLAGVGLHGGEGWVHSKYCKILPIIPVDKTYGGFSLIGNGPYVMRDVEEYGFTDEYPTTPGGFTSYYAVQFGKIVNNMVIYAYEFVMYPVEKDASETKIVKEEDGNYALYIENRYLDENSMIDWENLPSLLRNEITDKVMKMPKATVILRTDDSYTKLDAYLPNP